MSKDIEQLKAFLKQSPQKDVEIVEVGLQTEQLSVEEAIPATLQSNEIGDWRLLDPPERLDIPQSFVDTVQEMGDDKPMFATYVVPMGFSRKLGVSEAAETDEKHRYWSEATIDRLIEKIRQEQLPGNKGHASESTMQELPDPATLWVSAAKAEHAASGLKAAVIRGYVYDDGNNRMYVKTGAFRNVSPMAMVEQAPEVIEEHAVWHVTKSNPLSVDFVRQGTEGLRGAAQLSSEGAGMLTPEQLKLLAGLTLADLSEYRKDLVAEVAATKSDTKPDATLITEIGEVTKQATANLYDATVARETAKKLGCEVADLPRLATEFQSLNQSTISTAFEAALVGIENEKVREVVRTQLKDATFESPDDVKTAVESAMTFAKSVLVALGDDGKLGGVDENAQREKGNAVASPFMAKKLKGGEQ